MLVEVTGGDAEPRTVIGHEVVGYALSAAAVLAAQQGVEAQHGVLVHLKPQAGAEVAIGVEYVGASVEEQALWHVVGTDDAVLTAHLGVELHVAGDMAAHDALGGGSSRKETGNARYE